MTVKEDFLYYLWKFGKLHQYHLQTTDGEAIQIINLGTQNHHAGPDFFNAQLRIGNQLWAGNVEMHVNASDWFVHHHETDKNYDNVILHVVWNHDIEIHRKDNSVIPTLVLESYSDKATLMQYQQLLNASKKWIHCETAFPALNAFQFENWLERVYLERLEKKAAEIEILVEKSNYDWEAILFRLLAKGFGLKLNSEAFFEATCTVDFSIIRKLSAKRGSLEAFLFGIFGLLSQEVTQEPYFDELKKEFNYLCHKFQHTISTTIPLQFFRTRPANFPTIRTSQLATVYHQQRNLFSKIIATTSLDQLYQMLQVGTSSFWETHYTFEKISPKRTKKVSKKFIDVLLINSIIPLKYCYDRYLGKPDIESILSLLRSIAAEKNTIIQKFTTNDISIENAQQTQALLELKKSYCDQHKCLECAIGNQLMQQSAFLKKK
ncbi:DUF2851 family protein [Kordia algicida OT-1]|uniref:DUF2851 domain-containing protein n=1 Tax=Kordia algicida OT-1 TaxID=391587 RepID=A9E1T3_9FLAO|nr:DUF2851 family protein [Kordia algicida]EDP95671.1 hypothetical protein KAOT1_22506 [Kordia algicida OT-1]